MGLTRRQGRQPQAAGSGKGNKGKKGKKGKAGGGGGGGGQRGGRGSGGGGGGGALQRRLAQDVYDYGTEAQPRRRRRGDGDDDEEDGGANAEQYDYKPGEQEDEEIDEDGAFDSEDERRYGEVLRQIENNDERRMVRKKRGRGEEEESDDEEEDDEDDGGMLLSDMLGGVQDATASAAERKQPQQKPAAMEGDREEGEEESDEEEASEEEDSDSDDEEEEEENGEQEEALMGMVDRLIAAQQASSAAAGGDGGAFLQGVPDSAFGTRAAEGLTMEAMLGPLEDTRGYAAVRKRLGLLAQEGNAVAAPAPTVVQARAERQLTYQQKKRQVSEWLPLVAAARQAESLNFSYEAPVRPSQAALVGKFAPQTEMERAVHDLLGHARADKEAAVEAAEGDDLGGRGLTVEQVKVRRAELAKMRALLFYEQQKRHRANKIKSKAYHRIRKRQRLRQEDASREALRAVDPEAARALDEKEALARAEERMSLRHKNTSKWAKHAQRTQGATAQVDTRRALSEQLELGQQLRKKAGADEDSDAEEESDWDGEGEEGEGAGTVMARAAGKVRTLLGEVVGEEEKEAAPAKGLMGMKFMAKAVERQRARAREEVEAVLRELGQEERASSSSSEEEEKEKKGGRQKGKGKGNKEVEEEDVPPVSLSGRTLHAEGLAWGAAGAGKAMRVSGPITVAGAGEGMAAAPEAEAAVTGVELVGGREEGRKERGPVASFVQEGERVAAAAAKTTVGSAVGAAPFEASAAPGQSDDGGEEAVNPWLAAAGEGGEGRQRGTAARRGTRAGASAATAGVIDVGKAVAVVAAATEGGSVKQGKKGGGKGPVVIVAGGAAAGSDEEEEGEGEDVVTGRLVRTAEQAALVQRAFAHADPGGAEFAAEKEAAVEADKAEAEAAAAAKKGRRANPDKASGVAGWGSWAGEGAAAPKPPPLAPPGGGKGRRGLGGGKAAGVAPERKETAPVAVDKGLVRPRADKALPTVIVNERRVKKAASLHVAEVPYPFTSRQQYERAMRRPVGREWNTALAVREQTRPAVKVRPGTLVRPIKLRKTHKAVFPGSARFD